MQDLNLAWGNPEFLYPYWDNVKFIKNIIDVKPSNYLYGCQADLEQGIRRLHRKEQNAIYQDKELVIGNGATQVLEALIHVLGGTVGADSPHFSRFPKITELAGHKWSNPYDCSTKIITIPNNPDGKLGYSYCGDQKIIYDLSYNWKQYSKKVENFDFDNMVFSLSKATGHASTRLGWALIRNKSIAKQVRDYIEFSTGGVSKISQELAREVIWSTTVERNQSNKTIFEYGEKKLNNRWRLIKSKKFPFEVLNDTGMFMWCKGRMPYGLIGMDGTHFGYSSDYFRLNIGCNTKDFNRLITEFSI